MYSCSVAPRRFCSEIKTINEKISKYNLVKTQGNQQLKGRSTLLVEPVFVPLSFSEILLCFNVFSVFCFEPMHNLSLGVCCLVKRRMRNMLNNDSRIFSALETAVETLRSFNILRRIAPTTLNYIMADFRKQILVCGIRLKHKPPNQTNSVNGSVAK